MKDTLTHYMLTIEAQKKQIDELIEERNELKAKLHRCIKNDAAMIGIIEELDAQLKEYENEAD